jgi:adenylate kinase family enzyme
VEDRRDKPDRRLLIATFGPPGSGKSTVCHALGQLFNAEIVSPGLELRRMAANGGKMGREATQLILTGASVTEAMFWSMLANHQSELLVFDNAPQTVGQVRILTEFAADQAYDVVGVHLLVNERIARVRTTSRLSCKRCSQPAKGLQPNCTCGEPLVRRSDDKLASVFAERLRRYESEVRIAAEEFASLYPYREFDATLSSKRILEGVVAWLRYLGYADFRGPS